MVAHDAVHDLSLLMVAHDAVHDLALLIDHRYELPMVLDTNQVWPLCEVGTWTQLYFIAIIIIVGAM